MKKVRSHEVNERNIRFLTRFFPLVLPLAIFILSLITLQDYGFNWDSPVHFARGQAFLRFILTGKTDYKGLPQFCQNASGINKRVDYKTGEVCDKSRKTRVSEYESTLLDFSWARTITYGHPPFSDIMLAVTNQIFFKELGLVEDVQGYHLFSLFMMFLLLLVVSYWAKETFGLFAATVSVLSLATFPLLFAEQHFNVKDVPIAAFFTLAIFFFWKGITKRRALYILLSSLFGGMSFATKINYTFAPVILFPWIGYFLIPHITTLFKRHTLRKKSLGVFLELFPIRVIIALLFYPFVIAVVFFLSWPALWFDTIHGLTKFFTYYHDIGIRVCPYLKFSPGWILQCSDLLTVQYFLYSLPFITLALFFIGVIEGVRRRKEHSGVTILWLSFFFLTILRVTLPIASIYGGLRQILEFSSPMALLAGLGAVSVRDSFAKILKNNKYFPMPQARVVISFFILLLYLPIILTMIKIHPNENVYFNFLIGGVKGAEKRNFSGYGNSYGNVMYQGVQWLNNHAVKNAHLSLAFGLAQNISRASLRNDIEYDNAFRSGYHMDGEYQVVQLIQGDPQISKFSYQYLESFLTPVHTISVDGVPLLKIWKNDRRFIKKGVTFQEHEETAFTVSNNNSTRDILLSLKKSTTLKRLAFFYPPPCEEPVKSASVAVGDDRDSLHTLFLSPQNFTQNEIRGYEGGSTFIFAGNPASLIKISIPQKALCNLTDISFKLFVFN